MRSEIRRIIRAASSNDNKNPDHTGAFRHSLFIFLSAHTKTRVRINECAEICRGAIRHVSHNDKYQSYGTRRIVSFVTQTSVRFTRSPQDHRKGYNRKMPCSTDQKVLHRVMEGGALDRAEGECPGGDCNTKKTKTGSKCTVAYAESTFYVFIQALIKGGGREYEGFFFF